MCTYVGIEMTCMRKVKCILERNEDRGCIGRTDRRGKRTKQLLSDLHDMYVHDAYIHAHIRLVQRCTYK